jgi:ABC-type antimicrobial peptide transport system permease subunit
MYLPLAQNPLPALVVIVRSDREPLGMVPALREAVRGVDPTLALFEVGSASGALAQSVEERRFTLVLLGAFAAVALALAVVGIYGVVSFAVSERTRELGLRMALGAEPGDVFRMVLRQGLTLSLVAITVGTGAALLLGRVMERLLFGVEARDPLTFAAVAAILLAAAFAACALPARRATRVDPTTALRAD